MSAVAASTNNPGQAAATAPSPSTFIADVAAGRIELPTIPRVVQRLIVALRKPDVDLRHLVSELSQDPVLSAKVLRLANSSYFGGRGSLASIDSAVATIGTSALTTLIVACGISSAFIEVPGVNLRQFWRDALVAASAAHRVSARLEADAESAYVCGLMHATGHLILCKAHPEAALHHFSDFAELRGSALVARELEAFGIAHPTVGALWSDKLGFPKPVSEAIGRATQAPAASDSALDAALRTACSLAASVALGEPADKAVAALAEPVRARFSGADGRPDAAFDKLYDALQSVEPIF